MKTFLRLWCWFWGHTDRAHYEIGEDGLYHAKCRRCGVELRMTNKGNLFID